MAGEAERVARRATAASGSAGRCDDGSLDAARGAVAGVALGSVFWLLLAALVYLVAR